MVWVAFAAWACFYAAGGMAQGLSKTVTSTVSGLIWGWLILSAATQFNPGSAWMLGLCVALGAFGMCVGLVEPLCHSSPAPS